MTVPIGSEKYEAVALIDGECVLCHSLTAFAVKYDRKRKIRFAALQSAAGRRLLTAAGYAEAALAGPDSFLLLRGGRLYSRSGAVLRAASSIGGWFSLLSVFRIVPVPIRDAVYDWVARNRYRWFGKSEVCLMPSDEVRSRFLEDGLY